MTDARTYQSWIGRKLVDQDGTKIGRIDEIYHDVRTGRPAWVTVRSGLLRTRSTIVPVDGALMIGAHVQVPSLAGHRSAVDPDAGEDEAA